MSDGSPASSTSEGITYLPLVRVGGHKISAGCDTKCFRCHTCFAQLSQPQVWEL